MQPISPTEVLGLALAGMLVGGALVVGVALATNRYTASKPDSAFHLTMTLAIGALLLVAVAAVGIVISI